MSSRLPASFSLSLLLMISLLPAASLQARTDMISTREAMAIESGQALASVDAWFQREEVVAELTALGVNPEMARIRAQALSPAELDDLANRIEELPAGAGVIEVLGITFLVLLVLEFIGVINIFKSG